MRGSSANASTTEESGLVHRMLLRTGRRRTALSLPRKRKAIKIPLKVVLQFLIKPNYLAIRSSKFLGK